MLLTRYGAREWLASAIVAGTAIIFLAWLGSWWVTAVPGVLWLGTAWFFRDPHRRVPADLPDRALLSPADGTVTAVQQMDHHAAVGGPAIVIRIFLSIMDVHVNRSPADGHVLTVKHQPGEHYDARSDASSTDNESNLITMRLGPHWGEEKTIGVRQIAGKVARRIVCDLCPGDRLRRGQRFGMIKFGSGAELILPRAEAVQVHVRVGDRVKAGLTPLATMPMPGHSASK